MPSKTRESRLNQKADLETKLNERLSKLAEMGHATERIAKDALVKMLRADLRKTNARLRVIAEREKKLEDMAEAKAQKAVSSKKKDDKKQKKATEELEVSKRQQKKREKKEKKQSKNVKEAEA